MIEGYEWDEAKRKGNWEKHGIDFESIQLFGWGTALIEQSDRYGEVRYGGLGYIGDHLHYVVFTERDDIVRIISLRRANAVERRRYDQANI